MTNAVARHQVHGLVLASSGRNAAGMHNQARECSSHGTNKWNFGTMAQTGEQNFRTVAGKGRFCPIAMVSPFHSDLQPLRCLWSIVLLKIGGTSGDRLTSCTERSP